MSKELIIGQAIENKEANIAYLLSLSENDLSKKLDSVHLQIVLAEKTGYTSSMEILEVWRGQIIDARIYKAENNIPDKQSEIELAIADIETVARSKELIEVMNDLKMDYVPEKIKPKPAKTNDD